MQLRQADLLRRSKELDAREEYLTERERLIESGPLDLKVLEETIRVKTAQLEKIKESFLSKQAWYTTRLDNLQTKLEEGKKEVLEAANKVQSLTINHLRLVKDRLEPTLDKLKEVESEISSRQTYLKDQERLISETIDEGNAALRGIGYEIQAAQEDKDEVKQEIADLEQKKTDVAFELVQLEERHKQDVFNNQQDLDELTQEVQAARLALAKAQSDRNATVVETDEKLRQLKIIEEAVDAKRGALLKERTELENDKRRWNSTKALYNEL